MTKDEIIQMCRDACSGENQHAWDNAMWTIIDLVKSDEIETNVPWSQRSVKEE